MDVAKVSGASERWGVHIPRGLEYSGRGPEPSCVAATDVCGSEPLAGPPQGDCAQGRETGNGLPRGPGSTSPLARARPPVCGLRLCVQRPRRAPVLWQSCLPV